MFNSSKKDQRASTETTSLIASGTHIRGDVQFGGRLHVDGKIEGSIRADDAAAVLTLSSHAQVIGEIQAPHIIINGSVNGDVTADERLELASNARVEGNVYYKMLEMSAGAQINGKMVYRAEPPRQLSGPGAEESKS
ncbi:MAG TPA: polymer-forming cytoskeletal protein [Rhodanobacteraceae bacterium]|jgi:cytoskeletal protein CcmA (bactofilin family)|nr:polymer-forming cytoskeletal protein [Rhodanobacteraceae bacterium]